MFEKKATKEDLDNLKTEHKEQLREVEEKTKEERIKFEERNKELKEEIKKSKEDLDEIKNSLSKVVNEKVIQTIVYNAIKDKEEEQLGKEIDLNRRSRLLDIKEKDLIRISNMELRNAHAIKIKEGELKNELEEAKRYKTGGNDEWDIKIKEIEHTLKFINWLKI